MSYYQIAVNLVSKKQCRTYMKKMSLSFTHLSFRNKFLNRILMGVHNLLLRCYLFFPLPAMERRYFKKFTFFVSDVHPDKPKINQYIFLTKQHTDIFVYVKDKLTFFHSHVLISQVYEAFCQSTISRSIVMLNSCAVKVI